MTKYGHANITHDIKSFLRHEIVVIFLSFSWQGTDEVIVHNLVIRQNLHWRLKIALWRQNRLSKKHQHKEVDQQFAAEPERKIIRTKNPAAEYAHSNYDLSRYTICITNVQCSSMQTFCQVPILSLK
jgi:hypothetical protein